MNDEKLPDHLWFDVSRLLMLILFPYSSRRPEYLRLNDLVIYINGLAPEIKELTQPILNLGFHRGSHVNKKKAHMDTTFVSQSTPPLEMACTVD